MPEIVGNGERELDRALAAFMTEFANYLVAAGITNTRFAAIAKQAYFEAASAKARFGNERLNQSAVAAITGFTRTQVRAFARQAAPQPSKVQDRLARMIDGWMTDQRFSAKGVPRRLRIGGFGNTFTELAQKYGSDVPARALLRELQRHSYVTVRSGYVSLKRKARESCDETRVRRISQALSELLKTTGKMGACLPVHALTLETNYPAASDKGRALVQRVAHERLREYLSGLEAAGTAASMESPPTKAQKSRRIRTRVALITEEFE